MFQTNKKAPMHTIRSSPLAVRAEGTAGSLTPHTTHKKTEAWKFLCPDVQNKCKTELSFKTRAPRSGMTMPTTIRVIAKVS